MASNLSEGHPTNNAVPRPVGRAVVHAPHVASDPGPRDWSKLVPAWIASGAIHFVVVVLFLLIGGPAMTKDTTEDTVVETKVDDENKEYNLENPDIGNNPDLPTNYDIPRIAEVSVPGPVNASEQVGILNADPNAPPQTIPPPPGFGDNTGQGGGVDANFFGKANTQGFAGGMGGKFIPGGFGGRSGGTRERMVQEGGGNGQSEAAVARALEWFANHQASDGHWSLDGFMNNRCNCTNGGQHNDTAGTAFGLLPLLGAGQTHKGGGKNASKYTKNVDKAIKWLMLNQKADGNLGGGMYAHGLATIALCEAYGLTSDPVLQKPAQKAINYIVKAQNDNGGWRYTPRSGSSDTSVVGWQVMALKSGQMAGLDVPSLTLEGAKKWLDSCASEDKGAYGYTGPVDNSSAGTAMTAVGLLCRQYLGWGPKNPGLQAGVEKLKNTPPGRVPNMYYYYYATQVMHHMGGASWEFWNPKMRDMLVKTQDQGNTPQHAHQKGSWSPQGDAYNGAGGRLMMSSLCCLTLEVYYRHLPLYRRDQVGTK